MNLKPAKTPAVAIARILRGLGLGQGRGKDFRVMGYDERGGRLGTMVVLYNREANETVAENADAIVRASDEAGWAFGVGVSYDGNGKVWCDVSNFGTHNRDEKPAPSGKRVRAFVSLSGKRDVTPTLWIEDEAREATTAAWYLRETSTPVADEALAECGYRRTNEWTTVKGRSSLMVADVVPVDK